MLNKIHLLRSRISDVTLRQWSVYVAAVAGAFILSIIALGYLPRGVAFNYAGDTCTGAITPLPGIYKNSTEAAYDVELSDKVSLAGVDVLSRQICFTPTEAPKESTDIIAVSPWGGLLARKTYKLTSPEPPSVKSSVFERPIPTTRPLVVPLEAPDTLHEYKLSIDSKTLDCEPLEANLKCDVDTLALVQGESYEYEMVRKFSGKYASTLTEGKIETLRALEIVEQSIADDQIVYGKPESFTFRADKPISKAVAELKLGDNVTSLRAAIDGESVEFTLPGELERRSDYELTLKSIESSDGATLIEPKTVRFYVSDGPLVSGVSVGVSRVAPDQAIIITFDQTIAEQDLTKNISVEGVVAAVSAVAPNQVRLQLSGADKCLPFTIKVSKGLKSEHQIESSKDWQHTSRIICHSTEVYGYSRQGRALISYQFGNSGPVTMYVGAIHGNESSSMGILQSWISELEANPNRIGNRQIVIIPNVNPDGIAAGTRANANKVNLNRNFPTSNWVSDIRDTDGTHAGGGGSSPLSEPEAQALAAITSRYKPRLLVSYHAIGSLVVGDPGGYSAGKAAQYAGLVGYRNATGMSSTFDYDITGAYEDWTFRNLGIPSMIVELGSYSYHNFSHHRAAFWAMLD